MVEPGLVSTIIPVHNRPVLLREAVSSVLAQTYRPIEIIIIDDGSTDDTVMVAEELRRGAPEVIRLLRQANAGPGAARENGRQRARGEFIQYLDSDDRLLPRKFELQVRGLRSHQQCGVSYGMTRFGRSDSPELQRAWKRTGERIETMFPTFLESRWWGTSTPLYRRSVTDAAGPWTSLCNEEDWEYDCRVAALGTRLYYVPEFISEEREHSGKRLSRGGATDPVKLRARARAHALILLHARRFGLNEHCPEMRHFARALFLLSRQCGAAGLAVESRNLFSLSREAAGRGRGRGADFLAYALAARLFGWRRIGRLACRLDERRAFWQGINLNLLSDG